MSLYIDACGEKHMCYDWPNLTYYTPHPALSRCPPCLCDDSCFRNLNCCPDKFFERPLAVLASPSVYLADNPVRLSLPHTHLKSVDHSFIKYEIIETCPEFSNLEDKQRCEKSSIDLSFDAPVTSLANNFSYRNMFCAFCHGEKETNLITWNLAVKGNVSFEGDTPNSYHRCYFTEMSSLIKEEIFFISWDVPEFRIKFVNLSINTEFLVRFVKKTRVVGKRLKDNKHNDFEGVLKSLTTIAPSRICRADLLPGGVAPDRQCDCSYSCLFVGKCTCCVDTAIMHPIECISDTKFGHPQSEDLHKFAVVSNCYNNKYLLEISDKFEFETVKHLCETNPPSFDILIWSKKVTYKNIFCFLCNTNYSMVNDSLEHEQFEALEFTVKCPNQLNFIYAVNFTQLMNLAKTQGCHVTYATDKCILCETEDREVESRCPALPPEHPVKWLCENTSVNSFAYVDKYKNEFCQLCNSNRAYTKTEGANSCLTPNEELNICPESNNTSGGIPLSDEDEKTTLLKKWTIDDCKPTYGYKLYSVSPLRSLFSPVRIIKDTIPPKRNNKNIGELCYPGKILRKGSCVSIIEFPQNIKQFRVCVEEKQFSSATFDYGYVLEMFATILNVISIVSMMVLLILYMVVPGLRTLPGLNTMSTTFSLLCMQLTYMFANAVEKSSLFCTNKIGYGTTLCFVEDFVQNLATFIAPLLITCVVNIVMFTITVININSVKHIEKSKKDKSELVIFLKLFSLTGIVWIFQIVDGVLNISAFSFVATLLTSSQGTIIFLSFASSSRILKYLRSKRENKGKNEITDSKQTTRKGSGTSPLDLTKSTQAQGSSITI
uniref:G-protein coupled receptors family 2 profile 2 domain-containing protein n=1 Tax=Magallana gigas TaxID=29159 RepID=A0A8W8JZS5_MAGGI